TGSARNLRNLPTSESIVCPTILSRKRNDRRYSLYAERNYVTAIDLKRHNDTLYPLPDPHEALDIDMNLDPSTRTHYLLHRDLLRASGIQIDIEFLIAHRIGLRVQQVENLDALSSPAELHDRAMAIFRFHPYSPVVRVLPPSTGVSTAF
ncbi:MAG: hypothetical protein WA952_05130, partial [Lewinella sp.]